MLSSLRSYRTDSGFFRKRMPLIFSLAILLLNLSFSHAQDSEIGFEVGGYNYLGDIGRSYDISNQSLGAQFFIRKHQSDGLSTRLSFGAGSLAGADNEAFDVFSANRRASFEGNFVNTDLLFEYHFLDYRDERLQQYWTPYLLFGFGLFRLTGTDQEGNAYSTGIQLRFPVGIGIKYRLDRRWVLGISTSAIATGSDQLDRVSESNPNVKNYRGGNPNDNDWKFFTGISLSYTFYKIVCPQRRLR